MKILREVTTIAARFGAAGTPRFEFLWSGDPEMQRRHFLLATTLATALAGALAFGLPTTLWAATREDDARCARLDTRIAELHLKLRMGYSAKQGRLYRQKLSALEVERKSLCS